MSPGPRRQNRDGCADNRPPGFHSSQILNIDNILWRDNLKQFSQPATTICPRILYKMDQYFLDIQDVNRAFKR